MRKSLPEPPSRLASLRLPLETLAVGSALHRIHRKTLDAKFFGRSGAWRFDSPDGSYGTLYAALEPAVAFAETLLRGNLAIVAETELRKRALCRFEIRRPIRLVQLYGSSMARIGATALVTAGPYELSQRWSQALWSHPEQPDGIRYRATHDNDRHVVALFDRATDAIDAGSSAPLMDDPILLGQILDLYGCALIP
jgi:hypothetical protein